MTPPRLTENQANLIRLASEPEGYVVPNEGRAPGSAGRSAEYAAMRRMLARKLVYRDFTRYPTEAGRFFASSLGMAALDQPRRPVVRR